MLDYSKEEPITASVKDHTMQLMNDLRDFCATHNNYKDYQDAAFYIKEVGEVLEVLQDRNEGDIISICWMDWAGFILKDEEL